MIFKRLALPVVILAALASSAAAQTKPASQSAAQSSPTASSQDQRLLSKVEAYLRVLFAWGPGYQIKLGPAKPAQIPDLEEVPVNVNHAGQTENGTVYVTKDGRYMFRGEIRDMTKDPFAANRAKITSNDSPSIGPADAKVTVAEFSDFECPHCREMYSILKIVEPEFPQVRFVYKNFPLTEIHPWSMTAAIAARCAFQSSPAAFWKVHNQLFDNQDAITADNAWDEVTDFATSAGLSADAFHTCMAAPDSKAKVEADLAEGKALGVESTPTFFINGRPMIGGDKQTLEDTIRFELARSH